MDENTKREVFNKFSHSQIISIIISKRSGFDGLAAGLGLLLSLKKFGKNVNVNASQPTVDDARSLYGVDNIGYRQENQKDIVININNAVKNVDKVTYFLEKNQLKITVHSLPNSEGILKEDVSFGKATLTSDIIFAIGFESLNSLSNEYTHEQHINPNDFIMNIDNYNLNQKYAQLNLVNVDAPSISEIVTTLLKNISLPIDEDIAFNLFAGIKSATQIFSPSLVKESSFESAKFLINNGAGKASFAVNELKVNNSEENAMDQKPIQPKMQLDDLETISKRLSQNFTKRDSVIEPEKVKNKFEPMNSPLYSDESQTPVESVEIEKKPKQSWMKPPKVYRGSKSFDAES